MKKILFGCVLVAVLALVAYPNFNRTTESGNPGQAQGEAADQLEVQKEVETTEQEKVQEETAVPVSEEARKETEVTVSEEAQEETEAPVPVEEQKDTEIANQPEVQEKAETPDQPAVTEETATESAENSEPIEQQPIDTEPPVISGVKEIVVRLGDSISYKTGISVTDNVDKDIQLVVDKSKVNTAAIGVYPVYYSATDSAGNTATAETAIHIHPQKEISEEDVLPMLDQIIAQVTTPEMATMDKMFALWEWCRTKIYYVSTAGDRSSLWAGAYEGIKNRKGDCFVYYATYSLFLDRLGVENMRVSRINGKSNHWWSLVNMGNGWYHCDSSPRAIGHKYDCFMQTDAQLQEYNDFFVESPNYYTFDTTLYPERATEIIFDGWARRR